MGNVLRLYITLLVDHLTTQSTLQFTTLHLAIHTDIFTPWGSSYLCRVSPAHQERVIHTPKMQHREQIQVRVLAQGYFDVYTKKCMLK